MQERARTPKSEISPVLAGFEHTIGMLPSNSVEMVAVRDFLGIGNAERFRDEKLEDLQRKDLTEGERAFSESNLHISEQEIALAEHSRDNNSSKLGYLKAFDQISKKARALQASFEAEGDGKDEAKHMVLIELQSILDRRLRAEEEALADFYREEQSSQP